MAVELVSNEFNGLLSYLYKSWLPARSHIISAITHRFDVRYCYGLRPSVACKPEFFFRNVNGIQSTN